MTNDESKMINSVMRGHVLSMRGRFLIDPSLRKEFLSLRRGSGD